MVNKKNQNQDEFKNAIIIIVSSLVLGILALVFGGRYLYNSIAETNKILKEKTEYSQKLENKLTTLQALKEKEDEIREKNAKVLEALPIDKEVSRLFVQFEKVASESGLKINRASETSIASTVVTGQTVVNDLVRNVKYSTEAKASGGYVSFKQSLIKFEDALRLLGIDELTLTRSDLGSEMTINYTLSTYVRSK